MGIQKRSNKFISTLITILVLFMIFLTGPANAVELTTSVSDATPDEGDAVTINAQIEIENNEIVPFTDFTINVLYSNGSVYQSCTFDIQGEKSTCHAKFGNVTVSSNLSYQTGTRFGYGYNGTNYSNTSFGAGYGYGYDSVNPAQIGFSVNWTTPLVSADTAFDVQLEAEAVGSTSFTYKTSSDTTITVQNQNSGGGSGGGSGSNNAGGVPAQTTQKPSPAILAKFGLDANEVTSVTQLGQAISSMRKADPQKPVKFDNLPEVAKAAVEKALAKADVLESETEAKATVYEVEDSEGKKSKKTVVQRTITVKIPKGVEKIEVVEVIPKSVAASAKMIKGNFVVLEDDPVLAFTILSKDVKNDKATIEYTVDGDVAKNDSQSQTVVVAPKPLATPSKTTTTTAAKTTVTNNTNSTEEPVPTPTDFQGPNGGMSVLSIWIIMALVVIVAGGWWFFRVRSKPRDDLYMFSEY